jgi:hypothetical protein
MQNPARLRSRSRWAALAEGAAIATGGLPHELAEARLNHHFGHTGVLAPLPCTAIDKVVQGARHGWCLSLPIDYLGQSRELWLILPPGFPADPVRAFIHPAAFLHWPHVESDGHLCLWPEALSPVAYTPDAQMDRCLKRIQDILGLVANDADPRQREAEFSREWLSYWAQAAAGSFRAASKALLVTLPPAETTVLATCLVPSRDKQQTKLLIGSETAALRAWREALDDPKADIADAGALFVALARPPIGAPKTLEQVRELLSESAPALERLEHYLRRPEPAPFWVVLAVRDADPQVVAALELVPNPPAGVRTPHQRDQKRRLREWHRVAAHAWRVRVQSIERADPAWVHGRGFDAEAIALRGKRVTLIGCGSLGGLVAQAVAHAGIGRLTLVDPEILEAANLGRHVLDATSLGRAKAPALASRLRAQLPHLDVRAISHRVQDPPAATALENADLVICTAADWAAERYLMEALAGRGIPLLLSWAEPHALAGHSAVDTTGGCRLEPLFDRDGLAIRRKTDWPETEWALPGCSASHQPGTFNRLQHVAGVVVEHAIDVLLLAASPDEHRIWLGDQGTLTRLGGNWIDPPPSHTRASVIALPLPHAS